MEHANLQMLIAIGAISGLILWGIGAARRGRPIFIRRIAGLNAIDEAIGRAAEMGRPLLFHPGVGDVQAISTLAALGVLSYVARQAARLRGYAGVCDGLFPVLV
jgi:hypothetical protein